MLCESCNKNLVEYKGQRLCRWCLFPKQKLYPNPQLEKLVKALGYGSKIKSEKRKEQR